MRRRKNCVAQREESELGVEERKEVIKYLRYLLCRLESKLV